MHSGGIINRVDLLLGFSGVRTQKDSCSDPKNSPYSAIEGLGRNTEIEMDPFEESKS